MHMQLSNNAIEQQRLNVTETRGRAFEPSNQLFLADSKL